MTNIALGKKILEKWKKPEELTNGNYLNYDGHNGFSYNNWPAYLTLDLENVHDIETIRFLLWDKGTREHKYRLLTSEDFLSWKVYFDSCDKGFKGWQEFNFKDKIKARYIRIHCLWNSVSPSFCIVELQVYDKDTEQLNIIVDNKKIIASTTSATNTELGSGLPLTFQTNLLISSLEKIISENEVINPKPLNEIIKSFKIQVRDIEALENNIDSIRREIINPVKKEIEEGNRIGKYSVWGFWLGGISIALSIVLSLINNFPSELLFEKLDHSSFNQNLTYEKSKLLDKFDKSKINKKLDFLVLQSLGLNDDYKPLEKEMEISMYDTKNILQSSDGFIQIRIKHTGEDTSMYVKEGVRGPDTTPVAYAEINILINGKVLSTDTLYSIVNFNNPQVIGVRDSVIYAAEGTILRINDNINVKIKRVFRQKTEGNGQVFLDRRFQTIGVIC